MHQLKSFVSVILAAILLTACSSSKKDIETLPYQNLYNKAQTYVQEEDYSSAIRYLEAIDGRFKHSSQSEQIQLNLMYSYYKTSEYYKVIAVAERFVRNNPQSVNMDYVYYLVGLSNVRLGDNFIQDFFKVNRASRAVKNIRNAYGNFKVISDNFPQSKYVAKSRQWMLYLKNRLAEHEFEIVKYYDQRDAYVAIVNRVEEMIRYYPNCKATSEALPYLQKAFEKMGIQDSAQKTADLIRATQQQKFDNVKKPEYGEQF
ncbi:outer membrane protein assembly factor BamD [Pasteurella skyensis]|uniref:Outer membrane protein assembly factor BamD n=1 Tax=Phocoenobacter skyensis TaxID=97481 RepID=A0AAJ6N878_9PAST|nr:outer membrane protein assembly factor BamD [Pasteurella skyensis]MDP8161856.1 outer membrane protein assembly factor BamD [Pasteurella skyensis]MDP8170255.1 outer membrane protein assembly factor BamD [Pasteurella skyensis]MDP8172012.1 outer membrane protein assembly factor BamD [Pasteurella skyensis]MDP8174367.1 outer membrane protein assembly factor BamD [Pasteurella skyensis]MDP8176247.1 outer membrane protein assembly factor BamD [Pasteurella skyensis]